jgi:hypothetical protein
MGRNISNRFGDRTLVMMGKKELQRSVTREREFVMVYGGAFQFVKDEKSINMYVHGLT